MRRAFLAIVVVLVACRRDPAPRPLPEGKWWKKGVALQVEPKRIELVRREETERAPLIVEGPHESKMERDGSFTVKMTVLGLKRELLTRKGESAATDIHEALETATFDGEPIAKNGVLAFTLKFSDQDHAVEMCLTASKKCTRLAQE